MRSAYRHLAFTGTKRGITSPQTKRLHRELCRARDDGFLWMHNGDCIEADYDAAVIWNTYKGYVQLHPPIKHTYRAYFKNARVLCEPQDYLVRDKHMVECSELLIGCPETYDEQIRSGTWTTVRYGRKLHLRILLIYPDGTTRNEP